MADVQMKATFFLRVDHVEGAWRPRGRLQVFHVGGKVETFVCFRCGYPTRSKLQVIKDGNWDSGKRFVVLSPQMEDRQQPNERSGSSVRDFIDFAKANYDIDVRRIYLTGLSGGGAPIYNYLGDYSGGEVAAVSPMAGWYSTQGKECSWKQIPIWYFHSALDNVVPPAQHSTLSFNTLSSCPQAAPVPPRYTMYKNLGHSAWGPTYDLTGMNATNYPLVASPPGTTPYNVSLYDWFLQYSR